MIRLALMSATKGNRWWIQVHVFSTTTLHMGGAPFDDDGQGPRRHVTNGDQLKFSRFAKNECMALKSCTGLLLQAKRTIATSIAGGSSDDA